MPNFAALRAAVFSLSTKNVRGADIRPPPVGARVKGRLRNKGYAAVCTHLEREATARSEESIAILILAIRRTLEALLTRPVL